MSNLQAFLFGIMVALTPSLVLLAWFLWPSMSDQPQGDRQRRRKLGLIRCRPLFMSVAVFRLIQWTVLDVSSPMSSAAPEDGGGREGRIGSHLLTNRGVATCQCVHS